MSAKRFGMGASAIASGRSPSMDRISTRVACGGGVGVTVSLGAKVAVSIAVAVWVGVSVNVEVKAGVGGMTVGAARLGI